MNRVDSYEFGRIMIAGKIYMRDVIVSKDRVLERTYMSSHLLEKEQADKALELGPDVVVIGTGDSGVMNVAREAEKAVKESGTELIVEPTPQAVKTFNSLLEQGKKVVGVFHLTC